MWHSILYCTLVLFGISAAFDISRLQPIAENNIYTGNRMLYEREMNANNSAEGFLDVSEIPVRYDEAQLWRIYNISAYLQNEMPLSQTLERNFGGVVWKENSKYLDICINKENLNATRTFLDQHHIPNVVVMHENVQNLLDAEGPTSHSRSKRQAGANMNWQDYHDLDTIYRFMQEIRSKFPKIARLYSIGKTAEGRDLKVMRISENPRAYKKIWIDGGIHAREWISPATVTFIIQQIMSNWEDQPAHIKQRTWYFMPVVNPDGYVYSRRVNRMWRKNRSRSANSNCNGVDLNRNFDIGWRGQGSSTNPCSDIYRGTSPASERETRAIVNFLSRRKTNLDAYLTYHSYGQLLVYPWAYKAAKTADAGLLQRVGNTAAQRIHTKTGKAYQVSVTHAILGIAGGGSDDWSRAKLNVKFVYTVELRDKGDFGFVLPKNQIRGTAEEGLIVAQTVAQAIAL